MAFRLSGASWGIGCGIIGADGHDAQVGALIILPKDGQCLFHMLHVLGMPTKKHHQQGLLSAKVSREIVSPLTTSGRAKGGAAVPKGNMVDGVAAIPQVYNSTQGMSRRVCCKI